MSITQWNHRTKLTWKFPMSLPTWISQIHWPQSEIRELNSHQTGRGLETSMFGQKYNILWIGCSIMTEPLETKGFAHIVKSNNCELVIPPWHIFQPQIKKTKIKKQIFSAPSKRLISWHFVWLKPKMTTKWEERRNGSSTIDFTRKTGRTER